MRVDAILALPLLALCKVAFAGPTPQVDIERRSLEEIYKLALKESRVLRVAWGGDLKASQATIVEAFQNRFPDITLDIAGDLSKYLEAEIDNAYQTSDGKNNSVDVAVLQSLHDFPRWKDQGRLMHYKVSSWHDIYPEFVDPDGAYTGLYTLSFGRVIYNPSQITSIPRRFSDFLSSEYSNGRISLTYPNDDDAILYLFTLIAQKHGWEFIASLLKQNVVWVRGTATSAMLISEGFNLSRSDPTGASSLAPIISFASESAFTPGMTSAPTDDVYMTWPQTGAIFATTKNPETSKLFLGFLMDRDWQKKFGASGFATRKSFDKLGVFKQAPNMDALGYVKFMQDRKNVEAWRFQFERVVGLPQGINPNSINF